MHTLKLEIHNDIYNNIISLLENFDKKKIKIIENSQKNDSNKKQKRELNAVRIDTKNFIFNREEANER